MFWSAENNIFSKFGVKNIRVTGSAGSKIKGAGTAFYILTRMILPSRSQHCKTEFPFTVENVSF